MDVPIKVLIADDEVIVRKGLRMTVNWADYGMEIVADVPNGTKAWEAFEEHKPQVVITDIVMPELDGIELTKRIKGAEPKTKILLLSCHRDFEYAQQGIKLGVSGYLVKTAFEDEELDLYLDEFRREILAERAAAGTEAAAEARFNALFSSWLYGADNEFEGELQQRWNAEWSWMEHGVYLYVIQVAQDFGELLASLDRLDPGAVIPFSRERCYAAASPAMKLKLDTLLLERKSAIAAMYVHKSGEIKHPAAWMEEALELHRKVELERKYGIEAESWPSPLLQAVRLVADNLKYPWSVTEVAERVGLSRSHFSTLFKKVSGENFIDFLYRLRLELACELLCHTTMTLQEIGEQIGMSDGKYFSKWFKRSNGMTPSQFRGRQKDESRQT
ncbi:response regulator [Paenibacillus physcomitrellae]|uniref:Response regulator n=1 Tax=Paenibacillus physcomitrellae TaxID=1619311 RepID=A0ABQ1GEH9_9BACL|nr:response regulator [Paenibacillus physcomitrellae]GGA42124.1 hypothetical protein GCM10010917_29220 [Paenibacillus physcomitrellae]